MNDETMIRMDLLCGHKELVQVQELQPDGSLLMGGYCITYDRNGNETERTSTTWNCRVENYRQCMLDTKLPWYKRIFR